MKKYKIANNSKKSEGRKKYAHIFGILGILEIFDVALLDLKIINFHLI
jgi:hypothetical protein